MSWRIFLSPSPQKNNLNVTPEKCDKSGNFDSFDKLGRQDKSEKSEKRNLNRYSTPKRSQHEESQRSVSGQKVVSHFNYLSPDDVVFENKMNHIQKQIVHLSQEMTGLSTGTTKPSMEKYITIQKSNKINPFELIGSDLKSKKDSVREPMDTVFFFFRHQIILYVK